MIPYNSGLAILGCPFAFWDRDSSATRQFTDTHFEDNSPTELKTIHLQNWRQFTDRIEEGLDGGGGGGLVITIH